MLNEVERARRRDGEVVAIQSARGDRQAADHERVPRRQNFLIAPRPYSRVANLQQLLLRRLDERFDFLRRDLQIRRDLIDSLERVQMPAPFEVRRAVEAEALLEGAVLVLRQRFADFFFIPDIELAFVAFGIRIEAREVTAFGRLHVAHRPLGCGDGRPRIERIARRDGGLRIQLKAYEGKALVIKP